MKEASAYQDYTCMLFWLLKCDVWNQPKGTENTTECAVSNRRIQKGSKRFWKWMRMKTQHIKTYGAAEAAMKWNFKAIFASRMRSGKAAMPGPRWRPIGGWWRSLKREICNFGMENFPNIKTEEANSLTWQALIVSDSPPYDKGGFRIQINFLAEYPFNPP